MARELIIYCDESDSKGEFFENFYGGLLVESTDYEEIVDKLNDKKESLCLNPELKWSKITSNYQERYIEFIQYAFTFIRSERLKVRVMFTQKRFQSQELEKYHYEHGYFLLYYQFLKHSFGLEHSNDTDEAVGLRIYFDRLADRSIKSMLFSSFLLKLNNLQLFKKANISLKLENVAEIESHEHILLQVVDIILGAMQFKLNGKDQIKPAGKRRRGKRTLAKEKVYKAIRKEICSIRTNFNVGTSTSIDGDVSNKWQHPYRHWRFIPKNSQETDLSKHKKKKGK